MVIKVIIFIECSPNPVMLVVIDVIEEHHILVNFLIFFHMNNIVLKFVQIITQLCNLSQTLAIINFHLGTKLSGSSATLRRRRMHKTPHNCNTNKCIQPTTQSLQTHLPKPGYGLMIF